MDLRHFAIYAFAGGSGKMRWSRKNEVIYLITYIYTYAFSFGTFLDAVIKECSCELEGRCALLELFLFM